MTDAIVPVGDPRARVIWRDGVGDQEVETVTCPVLAVTPEAQEVLGWFDRTHEVTAVGGVAWWRMHTLPTAGGLAAQDARLMTALDYVRQIENVVIGEQRSSERADREADRGTRRRRRG